MSGPGFGGHYKVREDILTSFLKDVTGQLSQLGPFTFFKIDVGIYFLTLHLLDEMTETIGLGIKVGMINLKNITRKYNFCSLARTGDNCFNFMGG